MTVGLGSVEIMYFVGEVFGLDLDEASTLDGDEAVLSSEVLRDGISC